MKLFLKTVIIGIIKLILNPFFVVSMSIILLILCIQLIDLRNREVCSIYNRDLMSNYPPCDKYIKGFQKGD